MRKKIKQIFQSIEIIFRKIFCIKKCVDGEIFDHFGFVKQGRRKTIYFILHIPIFTKNKFLVDCREISYNLVSNGGGGATLHFKS